MGMGPGIFHACCVARSRVLCSCYLTVAAAVKLQLHVATLLSQLPATRSRGLAVRQVSLPGVVPLSWQLNVTDCHWWQRELSLSWVVNKSRI